MLNWRLRSIYNSLRTGPRRHIPPIPIIPTLNAYAPPLPRASHHRSRKHSSRRSSLLSPPTLGPLSPLPCRLALTSPNWAGSRTWTSCLDPVGSTLLRLRTSLQSRQQLLRNRTISSLDGPPAPAPPVPQGFYEAVPLSVGLEVPVQIPGVRTTARDIRPGSDLCRSDVRIRTRHKFVLHGRAPLVHTHCTGDLRACHGGSTPEQAFCFFLARCPLIWWSLWSGQREVKASLQSLRHGKSRSASLFRTFDGSVGHILRFPICDMVSPRR